MILKYSHSNTSDGCARRPAPTATPRQSLNAAQYWLAPERFARSCQRLGDRFLIPMPATEPWLCLTDPDDIKRVFTADTGVLRLGAALAKASPHRLVLGPTGLTNVDGPEHMRRRKMQLPPFHGRALASYQDACSARPRRRLRAGPTVARPPLTPHIQAITLEVMMAAVFGVTEPARVERLRAATLALLREGNSRRFFVQTMIVTSRENGWDGPFPRMRRSDGRGRRGRARRGRPAPRAPATSTRTTSSECSCALPTSTASR